VRRTRPPGGRCDSTRPDHPPASAFGAHPQSHGSAHTRRRTTPIAHRPRNGQRTLHPPPGSNLAHRRRSPPPHPIVLRVQLPADDIPGGHPLRGPPPAQALATTRTQRGVGDGLLFGSVRGLARVPPSMITLMCIQTVCPSPVFPSCKPSLFLSNPRTKCLFFSLCHIAPKPPRPPVPPSVPHTRPSPMLGLPPSLIFSTPCPVALRPYDQLAVMGPFLLALTAATPSYRGFLADTDVRWNQISLSVDDRCPPLPIPSAPSPHRSVSPPRAWRDRCGCSLDPCVPLQNILLGISFPFIALGSPSSV